jgi:Ca-activated chloride channel family protein
MRRLTLIALFLCLACAAQVRAQTPDSDDVIRVDTDVTNLPFTAMDKHRRFLTNLQQQDVRVIEDGVQQQLFTFQRETDRPLAIAFLIDISVSQEEMLPTEKSATRLFIENVMKSSKDQAAILPFTGAAYLEEKFTRDVLLLYKALERIEAATPDYLGNGQPLRGIASGPGMKAPPIEGTTAIWEAIALTSSQVMDKAAGQRRRVIVLLSDGWDTSSRLQMKDAIDRALAAETVVYAIGIGDSKKDGVDRDTLRKLAERTGGRAFFPKKDTDLEQAYRDIEEELRTQYLLAYSSSNKKRDGAYRQIKIELTNPDFLKEKIEIRHRPGYFASTSR